MSKRFLGDTPEERRANVDWLRSIAGWTGLAVMFMAVGYVVQQGRANGRFPPEIPPGTGELFLGALGVIGVLLVLALACAASLGMLWVVVRVIRSAWKT